MLKSKAIQMLLTALEGTVPQEMFGICKEVQCCRAGLILTGSGSCGQLRLRGKKIVYTNLNKKYSFEK